MSVCMTRALEVREYPGVVKIKVRDWNRKSVQASEPFYQSISVYTVTIERCTLYIGTRDSLFFALLPITLSCFFPPFHVLVGIYHWTIIFPCMAANNDKWYRTMIPRVLPCMYKNTSTLIRHSYSVAFAGHITQHFIYMNNSVSGVKTRRVVV